MKARPVSAATERRRLRNALKESREVLLLCSTRRFEAPEDGMVAELGARIGYGALMSAASKAWAMTIDHTPQKGAQHTCGPCETTVQHTIRKIDDALAGKS